jgi:hypothetical protein
MTSTLECPLQRQALSEENRPRRSSKGKWREPAGFSCSLVIYISKMNRSIATRHYR